MIQVTLSNRVDVLVDALVNDLVAFRAAAGTLLPTPVDIVVPNANVAAYLKLEIARRTGIATRLSFHFLVSELRSLLEHAGGGIEFLSALHLRHLILGLLADDAFLAQPSCAPLATYLAAGVPESALDRHYQLAVRLARLFEEYGTHRPEMLASWRDSERAYPDSTTEGWQQLLWRALFAEGGWRERTEGSSEGATRWRTLAELPQLIGAGEPLALPAQLHVFGLSYVSRGFLAILQQLGTLGDLHVHALTPCRAPATRIDERGRVRADAHPALASWARPGLVYLRELGRLPGAVVRDRTVAVTAPAGALQGARTPTLLATLKADLLAGGAPPLAGTAAAGRVAAEPDGSIQVLSCPGVQRELEVVAGEIWRLVSMDEPGTKPYSFNEIAVILCPSKQELYQAHVATVFGEHHGIPASIVDLPTHATSRVLELVRQLLLLPLGEFNREEMLGLLLHPLIRGGEGGSGGQGDWLTWCDELAIYAGADHRDQDGTYVTRDLYSWDAGLRRLTLGVLMRAAAPTELADDLYESDGELYLPLGLAADDAASAGRFARVVRNLIADARFAAEQQLTMSEWTRYFASLLDTYIAEPSAGEEPFLWRCHRGFAALADLDRVDARPVPYRVACAHALDSITSIGGTRGQYLMEGVVVSSFLPMRPLPFRAVFVLGLGEGELPARDARDTLDLQRLSVHPTDVTDPERDRTMFLETLLSARERLILSYVSRDSQTGEQLEPSTLIRELLHHVCRRHGFAPAALATDARSTASTQAALVVRHPLRRHDYPQLAHSLGHGGSAPAPSLLFSVQAQREARAHALREDLERHAGGAREASSLLTSARELHGTFLPAAVPATVGRALRKTTLASPAEESQQHERLSLSFAGLRRFLECPLQGWARLQLRMTEDDLEDPRYEEHEKFGAGRLERAVLLRAAFMDAARGVCPDLASAYDRRAERLELAGKIPTGFFLAHEREQHMDILAGWLEACRELGIDDPARLSFVHYGRADESSERPVLLPFVTLELPHPASPTSGRKLHVEIHGRSEAIDREEQLSVTLQTSMGAATRPGAILRCVFDYIATVLTAERPPTSWRAIVCTPDRRPKVDKQITAIGEITPDEAREWIATLVSDLLGQPHEYLLPIEAVVEWQKKDRERPFKTVLDGLLSHKLPSTASQFGPVRDVERFPAACDPASLIDRRFGLLFDRVLSGPWKFRS